MGHGWKCSLVSFLLPGSAQHQPVPGQAAAGDSAPVSAASRPCPSVLMPAQAWEAAAAPAWALLSVEEELGRAFPTLHSDLIANTVTVLIGSCQCSGELGPSFTLALKAVLAGDIVYFRAGWCCEVPMPVAGVHSPFFFPTCEKWPVPLLSVK